MTVTALKIIAILYTTVAALTLLLVLPGRAAAQEEVASALRRYKDREVSTGYYEEYEVLPRRQRPLISVPGVGRSIFPYSPTAAQVRIRTRLADSHQGIKFYNFLRCEFCHADQAKDIHTVRANLTCRQCHGGEPIASIEHFYSPMNPIRRHAYVCAKCHEGASASFASYIVHEPAAGSLTARNEFPLLYYAYWFMLLLLVGTLAFFIPHTLLVGARELIVKLKRSKMDDESVDEQDLEQDIEEIKRADEREDQQDAKPEIEQRDKRDDKQDARPEIGQSDAGENSDGQGGSRDGRDKQDDQTYDERDDKQQD